MSRMNCFLKINRSRIIYLWKIPELFDSVILPITEIKFNAKIIEIMISHIYLRMTDVNCNSLDSKNQCSKQMMTKLVRYLSSLNAIHTRSAHLTNKTSQH